MASTYDVPVPRSSGKSPLRSPILEEAVPAELKLWRRWSHEHHREMRQRQRSVLISHSCNSCGVADLEVRCRSCGTASCLFDSAIPADTFGSLDAPSSPSESDGGSTLSTPSFDDNIAERDFASRKASKRPVPIFRPQIPLWNPSDEAGPSRAVLVPGPTSTWAPSSEASSSAAATIPSPLVSPVSSTDKYKPYTSQPLPTMLLPMPRDWKRRSHIASVRQSMIEAVAPTKPRRWFERHPPETELKFKFVLTPRGKAARAAVPIADEHGSTPQTTPAGGESGIEAGLSSKPPSAQTAPQSVSLAELAGDPSALQRLLVSAMFLMRDVPEKEGEAKRLDLGIVSARGEGMRGFAMKHEKKADVEQQMMGEGMKRVMWKVSLK